MICTCDPRPSKMLTSYPPKCPRCRKPLYLLPKKEQEPMSELIDLAKQVGKLEAENAELKQKLTAANEARDRAYAASNADLAQRRKIAQQNQVLNGVLAKAQQAAKAWIEGGPTTLTDLCGALFGFEEGTDFETIREKIAPKVESNSEGEK